MGYMFILRQVAFSLYTMAMAHCLLREDTKVCSLSSKKNMSRLKVRDNAGLKAAVTLRLG